MDKLLNQLNAWIKIIQSALLGTTIIEGIVVIIIGVASNKITDTFNYWMGILIGCSLVYIFLLIIRMAYQLKFPGSIVEELISKRQLEKMNKLFDRQKAINEYINSAIQGLNEQTCSIDFMSDRKHLCDKELEVRLYGLLKPVISYTDVILDTSKENKFNIVLHIESYQKFPSDDKDINSVKTKGDASIIKIEPISDKGLLILSDDLGLKVILPKDLVNKEKISGASYEIQTAIKRTLNNNNFNTHDFIYMDKKFSIICSEILEVCSNDYVNGVFFIIHQCGQTFPTDVPDVLRIFNRVTANYVSKYNACINDEIITKKEKANNA